MITQLGETIRTATALLWFLIAIGTLFERRSKPRPAVR